MSFSRRIRCCLLIIALIPTLMTSSVGAASEELVKGAAKEGSLMIYGTTQIDHMQEIIKHFNQRYPSIHARFFYGPVFETRTGKSFTNAGGVNGRRSEIGWYSGRIYDRRPQGLN